MFDDLFGGLFDFDGDGKTDFLEEMTGLSMINMMVSSEKKESIDNSSIIAMPEESYLDDTCDDDSVDSDYEEIFDELKRKDIRSEIIDLEYELEILEIEEPDVLDYLGHEEWEEQVDEIREKISELEGSLEGLG